MKGHIYKVVNLLNILTIFKKQLSKTNLPKFIDFEGFGTVSNELFKPGTADYKDIENALFKYIPTETEHILKELRRTAATSFFTPDDLIEGQVLSLKKMYAAKNINVKSILEPSAGSGKYIKHLKKHFPHATIYALEKDKITANVLQYNYFDDPKVIIKNTPFEEIQNLDFPTKYDLIISNIPFGSVAVFDPTIHQKHTRQIHNYFFAKALELSHENTITSFITSKGFLDSKRNDFTRNYIHNTATFLGAFRFPNHTFKNANTAVVADLVYIQKGNYKLPEYKTYRENSPELLEVNYNVFKDTPYPYTNHINNYFKENPKHIFGDIISGGLYKVDDFTVKSKLDIATISYKMLNIAENFKINNYKVDYIQKNFKINTQNEKSILGPIDSPIKPTSILTNSIDPKYKIYSKGNLYIDNRNKLNIIKDFDHTKSMPLILSPFPFSKKTDVNRIAYIIEIRNSYNSLQLMDSNTPEFKNKLADFNNFYDQFNFQYQDLNAPLNLEIIKLDYQSNLILSLETYNKEKKYFTKGDAFNLDYYKSKNISTTAEDVLKKSNLKLNYKDAVALSYNKFNLVNFDFLTEHFGISKQEFIDNAIQKNALFLNPIFTQKKEGTFLTSMTPNAYPTEFISKDMFYAGYIGKKIEFFNADTDLTPYSKSINNDYKQNLIASLELIKPEIIDFSELNAKVGENWIDTDIITKFVKKTYDVDISIKYNKNLDKFFVDPLEYDWLNNASYLKLREQFNIKAGNGRTYTFEKILEGTLNSMIPTMKITIQKEPRITRVDKTSLVDFENKMKLIDRDFNTYVMEIPMLKRNLEEKYHNLYNAYIKPSINNKHLTFENLQFEPYPVQRDATMQIIQNNGGVVDHKVGWGKTITAAMIAMKLKSMGVINKSMMLCLNPTINDVEKNIKSAYPNINILTAGKHSFTPKNKDNFLEQIKTGDWDLVLITHENYHIISQNIEMQTKVLQEELDNIDKDLEAMGIPYREVSKKIKKGLETRKENLKVHIKRLYHNFDKKSRTKYTFDQLGIDHLFVDESHKYKNLAYTTRHNRVAGLNTKEGSKRAFNLLIGCRTLQEKYGGDKGVTFLSGTTIANSITELYVIFKFLRPHKLAQLNITSFDQWVKIFGIKSMEIEKGMSGNYMLKERFRFFTKVPELARLYSDIAHVSHSSKHIKTPNLNTNFVMIKPFDEQKAYFKDLERFAATPNLSLLNDPNANFSEEGLKASALIAMNYMMKASLDMRIVNPDNIDSPENRIRTTAKNVARIYQETSSFNGTQLVFSDKSTPKDAFNIYDELKRVLTTDYNIPEKDVVFIHHYDESKKKDKLISDFNKGDVRIIIGSTQKLGTGLNIQERGVAIHHFDIPFRPSDFEQRIGRSVRKGNIFAESHHNNKVDNYLYATIGSIDLKLLELNSHKSNFINQIKNSTITARTIDEGAIDANGSMSYNDFVSSISDNDHFVKIQKLKKEKEKLTTQKVIASKTINNNKTKQISLKANLDSALKMLPKLEANKVLFATLFPNNEVAFEKYSFYKKGDDKKQTFDKFTQIVENAKKENEKSKSYEFTKELFSYDKLKFIYNGKRDSHNDTVFYNYNLYVLTPNKIKFTHGSRQLVKNEETMLNYPMNALSKINGLIRNYKNNIEDNTLKLKVLKNNNGMLNFTKKDQDRLFEINDEIKNLEFIMLEEEQEKINKNNGINDDEDSKNKGKGNDDDNDDDDTTKGKGKGKRPKM